MKRNPLQKFIPFRLALIITPLLAAWPQQSRAANQEWKGATGGAWLTLTNWTSTTGFPGKGTATVAGEGADGDVMTTLATNTAANIGINQNTLGGQLALGAIDFTKTDTVACTIGNSSTTNSGILQLNGATLGVANTLVRNNGAANLTISNVNTGSAATTMGVRLGITNGVLDVATGRTLTINPIISEAIAGSGITKTGLGTAVLAGANTYTGPVTVNDGVLQIRSNAGNGVLVTNSGAPTANDNNALQLSGGVTVNQPITLENLGNGAARVILESVSTANANANTWAGPITLKSGMNQALNANTAPFIVNGNVSQDASPSTALFIRGTNTGTINGTLSLGQGCMLFKTDTSIWQINSTGNVTGPVGCAAGNLILNNNNALEADTDLTMGQTGATTGVVQINAGFTQELVNIATPTGSTSVAGHSILGPGTIDFGAPLRNITVQDNTATLNDLTISAPILGAGGFNKQGPGNLIVNGAVSGPVTVVAGGLGGTGTLSSGVTVNAAGILGAGTATTAGTLTSAGITLQAATSLAMNLGSAGNDLIANTGTLVSGGTTIGVLPNGSFTTGQDIPVIGYTGVSPTTAPFTITPVLGTLGSRATATVVDLGTSIGIHINTADKSVWTGGAGNSWDLTGSANWKLASDSSPTTYQQYDAVVFDDSGTNTNIAITGATTPVRAEFINTTATPYSIAGPGSMGGIMMLDKTGNGTVTLTGANTYTGATNVNDGLLIANHNTGVAATAHVIPVPATSRIVVGSAGTFRAIANDTVAANVLTVAAPISGTGTVELNPHATAAGILGVNAALTADNSAFTGTLKLLAPLSGYYRMNNPSQLNVGSGSIVVESGAQVLFTSRTISNPITIAGTGWNDANGFIGALRLDSSTYTGDVTIAAGGGRIGAHNSTSTVSGNISGGPLEANVSNYANNYTLIFTGSNSYTTTTVGGVGGVAPQNTTNVFMRLNIGAGGTTGTLGSGAVTIAGDTGATNGTNGVLGFDRSDGYTLGAGNTISVAGGSLARTYVDLDCTGTGFANNGVSIDMGTPGGAAGNLRAGVNRANTVSTLTGNVETGAFIIGNLTTNPSTNAAVTLAAGANVATTSVSLASGGSGTPAGNTNGASLNIAAGATLTATGQIFLGEQPNSGATVTQNGNVSLVTQLRMGHWGTELSTYNMNGGTLLISGASSTLTPSTAGAGAANATGDNNIDALPAVTTLGGGIYLGIDGTGVLNHTGGTVSTNWIVLDNRTDSTTGGDGIDRYNISGSALLKLRSEWGLIARNASTDVSLGGGTIQLDNSGAGGSAGNTGPDLDVPLDAILNTVAATTTTLDTNGSDNSFTLPKAVAGSGNLDLTGGGTTTIAATSASGAYAGSVTVNSGILRIDGVLGGSQVVKSGATLAGGGTGGAVTVESGGILSPGASVGTLSAASVSLQSGSHYDVEIAGAATNDKVIVTGSLTSNGTIRVMLSGYTPVLNDTFDIADAASFSGTPSFNFSAAVLTAGLGWDTTQFSTNGTIKVVTASGDPFNTWAAGFGLTGGKDDDDDGDGASNLLEFATNADPTSGVSGARAFGRVHLLGADSVLTLTVAVRKSAVFAASGSKQTATKDMVVYTVEGSDDLAIWNSVVVTELNPTDSAAVQAALTLPVLGADWEWHTFRTDGTTLLDPRDMIRLNVAAAP